MPVALKGSTSGEVVLTAPAVAGTNTITLPAATGTALVPTSSGTTGQFLTSAGTGAAPTWSTVTAANIIDFAAVSGATSSAITSIPASYSTFWVSFSSGSNSASGTISVAVSSNNGSTYGANVTIGTWSNSNRSINGWLKITNVGSSGVSKVITGYSVISDGVLTTVNSTEAVVTGVINAVRFTSSAASTALTATLFGVP